MYHGVVTSKDEVLNNLNIVAGNGGAAHSTFQGHAFDPSPLPRVLPALGDHCRRNPQSDGLLPSSACICVSLFRSWNKTKIPIPELASAKPGINQGFAGPHTNAELSLGLAALMCPCGWMQERLLAPRSISHRYCIFCLFCCLELGSASTVSHDATKSTNLKVLCLQI
jgi:hypothetical protein